MAELLVPSKLEAQALVMRAQAGDEAALAGLAAGPARSFRRLSLHRDRSLGPNMLAGWRTRIA